MKDDTLHTAHEAKVVAMREKAIVWKQKMRDQCKAAWEAKLKQSPNTKPN